MFIDRVSGSMFILSSPYSSISSQLHRIIWQCAAVWGPVCWGGAKALYSGDKPFECPLRSHLRGSNCMKFLVFPGELQVSTWTTPRQPHVIQPIIQIFDAICKRYETKHNEINLYVLPYRREALLVAAEAHLHCSLLIPATIQSMSTLDLRKTIQFLLLSCLVHT